MYQDPLLEFHLEYAPTAMSKRYSDFLRVMLVCAQLLSHVHLFVTLWTVACQALLSIGFSRREYWSGLPFPSIRDLPDPGIEPAFPALVGRFFTTEPPGKPRTLRRIFKKSYW